MDTGELLGLVCPQPFSFFHVSSLQHLFHSCPALDDLTVRENRRSVLK